jgi:hypothetical protein
MFCPHHKSRFRRLKATEGNDIRDELVLTKTISCALCLGAITFYESLTKLLGNQNYIGSWFPSFLPTLSHCVLPSLFLLLTNSISHIEFIALSVMQEISCKFFEGAKWQCHFILVTSEKRGVANSSQKSYARLSIHKQCFHQTFEKS